jgi:RNA polymerase sigma factor (sigma-70 family)
MVAVRTNEPGAVDDLAHEVMLAALCTLREQMPRNPETLPAFVFGIARNVVSSYFRRQRRDRTVELSAAESIPDRNVLNREREILQDARREIERLDPADREVLHMTLTEGLEPIEIAQRLGMPAATVRQRKARAIKRLIERLSRMRGTAPL